MKVIAGIVCALVAFAFSAAAAGPRTHAEMGQRAWEQHIVPVPEMLPGLADIRADDEAMRAFYCGCTFPDFGYNGINDDAAEYAHWYPYQKTYVEYLKERFPPPRDEAVLREMAFFFGILCHGVGDVPWHFDEDGHKSFLTMAREQDNSGHAFTEHVCDIFSHVVFDLEPEMRGRFVWMKDTALEIFQRAGVAVNAEEIARGCRKQEADWLRGARLGPVAYPYFQAKIPWCRAHLEDYYYGGIEHGAALTAMCIRYYYAELNGWHYYQNIPIQASAFPRDEPYKPCVETTVCGDSDEPREGVLAIGNGGSAVLWFDVSDISPSAKIERATLWLRRVEAPVKETAIIAGHTVTGPGEGDFDPSPQTIQRITDGSRLWVAWDVTTLVRQWVRGLVHNRGILLKSVKKTGKNDAPAILFYSSSALKARPDGYGGSVVAYRPVLVVR